MSDGLVFITAYGVVRAGPKFTKCLSGLLVELGKSKRTMAYKRAKLQVARLSEAVCVLAEVEWNAGCVMEWTP